MGFSISGLLNDVGISLPKINLGNIGKDILTEGKNLLGQVVKDSFTLSNKPGQTFDPNMNLNILGDNIRLPNPIGSLANKLLGGLDGELNKFGVNLDFKTILGKLFNLPTESGNVSVPPLSQRLASVPGANATGGGASVSASNATPGANATGGASGGTVESSNPLGSVVATPSGLDPVFSGAINMQGKAGTDMAQAEKDMQSSDPKVQAKGEAEMQQASTEMQRANEMFQMISQIFQDQHQTRQAIIQNMR